VDGCVGHRLTGKRKREDCSSIDGALSPNASTVTVDEPLDYGQADAGTRVVSFSVQALEHTEQLAGVGHIKTGSIVSHIVRRPVLAFSLPECDGRVRMLAREFPGVAEQVIQDDSQQSSIAVTNYARLNEKRYIAIRFLLTEFFGDFQRRGTEVDFLKLQVAPG
jgi:hypothetical protein